MTYVLMNADYRVEHEKPVIYLFARDGKGKLKSFAVTGFKPYFWVPENEVTFTDETLTAMDKTTVAKVEVNIPREVREKRRKFSRAYEADILFPLRFLIDRGIRAGFTIAKDKEGYKRVIPAADNPNVRLKRAYLDIEVKVTGRYPADPRTAKNMILALTLIIHDPNKNEHKLYAWPVKDEMHERSMLIEFIQVMEQERPDVIVGWNIFYDLATIVGRAKWLLKDNPRTSYHNISPMGFVVVRQRDVHIAGVSTFDLRDAYARFFNWKTFPSYKLNDIVKDEEYGLGWNLQFDYQNDMHEDNLDAVMKYNGKHTEALYELDIKFTLVDQNDDVRRAVGCRLEQSLATSQYADVLLLRLYKNKLVLPSKYEEAKKYEYEGALVLQPKRGVFENVVALDFSAMYPTAIISQNLSPETLTDEHHPNARKVGKHWFMREPRGVVPIAFQELLDVRKEVKKEMRKYPRDSKEYKQLDLRQYALKQLIAAMYGYFALEGGRMYYPQVSEATTYMGRYYMMQLKELVEKKGFNVLYGDTDAVLIEAPEDPIRQGKELENLINHYFQVKAQELNWYISPNVEFEQAYGRLLFSGKKKRYAGICIFYKGKETEEIIIKGFEARRSDAADITRKAQLGAVDIILRGKSERELRNFVKEMDDIVSSLPLEECGIPKKLKKYLDDYKVPGYVQGMYYANKHLGKDFGPGDRPFVMWVKKPLPGKPVYFTAGKKENKYKLRWVALENNEDLEQWHPYVDWGLQTQKIVHKKLEPILEAYGLSMSEILSDQKQMPLEAFA